MRWWRKVPTVALFDLGGTGAALRWTDVRSRAVALEMFVELARRLEAEEQVERLRLSGLIGPPIDVADVAAFVEAAPQLLTRLHQAYQFEFLLNEGARAYQVRHLDQGASGIWLDTPADAGAFWSALTAVLRDFAAREDEVRISAGAWETGPRAGSPPRATAAEEAQDEQQDHRADEGDEDRPG